MTSIHFRTQLGTLRIPEASFGVPLMVLVFFLAIGGATKLGVGNSLGWAVVYLITVAWFALTPERTLKSIFRFWPVLVLPALALFSLAWSSDPGGTLRTGVQFLFTTLLGLRLADALSAREAIIALFAATATGVVMSVLALGLSPFQPIFENNGAFIGSYPQKTVAGVAFTLFALSAVAAFSLIGRRWIGIVFALAIVPVIVLTKSVSAMILLTGLGVLLIQGYLSRGRSTLRFGAILFLVALIGLLGIGAWVGDFDVIDEFLALVGKGRSLTGRTDIWALGLEVARDHPVLGTGFAAFWGNPAYTSDWGYLHAVVDPRLKGFHNLYIEALVTTGILGLLVVIVTYVWITLRALFWFVETGHMDAALWLTIMISALMLSFVDNVLFGEHEFFHLVAVMTFVFTGKRVSQLRFRVAPAPKAEFA